MGKRQRVICLDFESTLVPEFWPTVADKFGIEELRITTKEYPSFPDLMVKRIGILNENEIKLPELQAIADKEKPLEGAKDFVKKLKKAVSRVLIVSDFAEELASPMLPKFEGISYFGHRFVTFPDGKFSHYDFRQDNPKQKVVAAMQLLEYDVYAVGDSYNDITMLEAADKGIFFRASDKIREEFPQIPHTESFDELFEWLTGE